MRGRSVVALVLLAFVLVAVAVVWRRTVGIANARELEQLTRRRLQLVAQRGKLLADIREAASRSHIAPIAERRLDMHIATDSQLVLLPRPRP
jgi:membrane protein implicated in regulation of membrane protease activity